MVVSDHHIYFAEGVSHGYPELGAYNLCEKEILTRREQNENCFDR